MNQFIALDFETANRNAASICSVGMVKVDGTMMTETFYTLVNPESEFTQSNINVHGIHPEDVTDAPTFKEVYPHMLDFIGNLPVVCHFAQFDMTVLAASIRRYHFEMPVIKYFCSVIMARNTVKNHSYSLKNMMQYYNIDFKGHHHALNDAKACAMITVRLLKHYDSLDDYLLRRKKYISGIGQKSRSKSMDDYKRNLLSIKPTTESFDKDHPFYQKYIGISGTLHTPRKNIVQYIKDKGGHYTEDLDGRIDIFLIGKQKGNTISKKEQMIRNKIALGEDILIISDLKLKQLISFYG